MTSTDEQQLPPATDNPDEFPAAATNGASILDGVRAIRDKRIAEDVKRLDIDIPGYENRLAVIYHYPDEGYARVVRAIEREQSDDGKDPNVRIDAACDVLIACCLAVVGRDESGALVDPLSNVLIGPGEMPDNVFRFNMKLAERLEIDVPAEVKAKARFIVRAIFSPRGHATGVYDGDLALISTSNVVFNWLNGAEVKIDEDTSGE